jgi:hypothetical protein
MTTGKHLLLIVSGAAMATIPSGCGQNAPAAPNVSGALAATAQSQAVDLPARVKVLEDLIPDQAHIMADVADHFANLWFAGTAENWPLAEFYLNETRSHLRWAVRRIPVRKDNLGHDVKLESILQAFENGPLEQLKRTVASRNRADFEKSYKETLSGCYACHKASDKPFLRPRVPTGPATPIINFDPDADWPH